jgi:hypothetical protein
MKLAGFYLSIIHALNTHQVKYLLIGGHAVNYHGYIRATLDMDIWVETTEDNLRYLHKAFINLGYQEKSCNEAIVHLQKDHLIKDR